MEKKPNSIESSKTQGLQEPAYLATSVILSEIERRTLSEIEAAQSAIEGHKPMTQKEFWLWLMRQDLLPVKQNEVKKK